jgi:hypothetical protein
MIVLKVFMFLFLKVDGNENRKGSFLGQSVSVAALG